MNKREKLSKKLERIEIHLDKLEEQIKFKTATREAGIRASWKVLQEIKELDALQEISEK